MPRTYRGHPDFRSTITVEDGGGPRIIKAPNEEVGFAWGNPFTNVVPRLMTVDEVAEDRAIKGRHVQASDQLAKVLAMDFLGSEEEATKVYQRLKRRTVSVWRHDQPWSLTERELRTLLDDIEKIERDTAQMRHMMATQVAPIVHVGGIGPGGARIERSPTDTAPDRDIDTRPKVDKSARDAALAKLSDEDRRALGL
jgi:hypothetical protein